MSNIISRNIAEAYKIVPRERRENKLILEHFEHIDNKKKEELSFLLGLELVYEKISPKEFRANFKKQYGFKFSLEIKSDIRKRAAYSDQNEKKDVSEIGSTISQVNAIINNAIEMNASDIHIEPYEKSLRLRYRLDGVLHTVEEIPTTSKKSIISRIKIMAHLDIAEKRRPQDGKINLQNYDRDIDIRVSTLPTSFGEKVVLRILDKNELRLDLEALGFQEEELKTFNQVIQNPYGMILVTGPTGSGKTTTLYAALERLNDDTVNITTIEDPIEYNLAGINQTHVKPDIGFTFSRALRAFLRQDPDIIMVGEIRDGETAEIATRSSLTGHMVFSTIHTNNAPSTVGRLMDMGVEPFLLASSLKLILAQRLVRKICDTCKTNYSPPESLLKELKLSSENINFYRGEGCEKCHYTGYNGRTALFELMPVNEKIAGRISSGANTSELKTAAKNYGFKTLREVGIQKIKQGLTSIEEVIRQTTI